MTVTGKSMAKPHEIDDLDELIDRAVDTFFVEGPGPDELAFQAELDAPPAPPVEKEVPKGHPTPAASGGPSLDDVVDTLFMSSFDESPAPGASVRVTSGDVETDRAIDLAVDTLFIEEPESPAPETAQIEVEEIIAVEGDEATDDYVVMEEEPVEAYEAVVEAVEEVADGEETATYDDAMALEVERHMHTLFQDIAVPKSTPPPTPAPVSEAPPAPKRVVPSTGEAYPLRKLQEAILTLEWEISKRSVTVLNTELHRVRQKFQDNATVDFAIMSMRLVLDYVVKRMSRAHPESIRFLLDVTDFLDRSLATSMEDPLRSFHHILMRYETYKSVVRRAEGLVDRKPPILNDLEIKDTQVFVNTIQAQTTTLMRAGKSLAKRLATTKDPEHLIRSFRFLVNRSVNRILESTQKNQAKRVRKAKTGGKA
jgi:hypothetical protein